ncbi:MAG: sulfatase [Candidatus Hydrogenedentes bacterium]|nr:sulfatase [Candidatus Hydrogenedentota bacterium]
MISSLLQASASERPPNFVIIFTDDQGYADVGCFGAPDIKTPRLDRMATEGMRFTDFYSAAPVCTPSRAALMTGCYPQRVGMAEMPRKKGRGHVIFPDMTCGLNPDEVTIAELLKSKGYATACVGKWHLGHKPPFLPTRNGFDSYFGIPYSNDMKPSPLMRNEETVEEPANQDTLTERYTEEAVRFIRENKECPFFLYMPHNMPHTPLHVSDRFRGKSAGGLYGDVIEMIDWSVGTVLDALTEAGVDGNTLVVFTSDNGPWYSQGEDGGHATPFRAGKGTTFEGGMREPCIMRWPGHIPAGSVCHELATTMDILPTFAGIAGAAVPTDRTIDGKDILPLISGEANAKTPHEAFFYYNGNQLDAVRSGDWKLRVATPLREEQIRGLPAKDIESPEALFNLRTDPGEQKSVISDHPEIAERLRGLLQQAREDLGDARTATVGKNVRPVGLWNESESPDA